MSNNEGSYDLATPWPQRVDPRDAPYLQLPGMAVRDSVLSVDSAGYHRVLSEERAALLGCHPVLANANMFQQGVLATYQVVPPVLPPLPPIMTAADAERAARQPCAVQVIEREQDMISITPDQLAGLVSVGKGRRFFNTCVGVAVLLLLAVMVGCSMRMG